MFSSTEPGDGLDIPAALGALVGKTPDRAGGTMNLLLSHMLDTAAVAERMWEDYLAPSTRRLLDRIAGGVDGGRPLFVWLCGMHDYGKATPAFQQRMPVPYVAAVRRSGLKWHGPTAARYAWRHERAGAHLLRRLLQDAGWPEEQLAWVWPLVAGHHGFVPVAGALKPDSRARGQLEGGEDWAAMRSALARRFTEEVGLGPRGFEELAPVWTPPRAVQLQLSGLIVMADWIASGDQHFEGLDELSKIGFDKARRRAARAWKRIGLRGGWGELPVPAPDTLVQRFGCRPRPVQTVAAEVARQMEAPGLLIVEAPMGEGKTRAALSAAEILAARFGADGLFVGMPAWSSNDPTLRRVREWLRSIDGDLVSRLALLHGRQTFRSDWIPALQWDPPDAWKAAVGDCEEDTGDPARDRLGRSDSAGASGRQEPASWFFGYARGLLCPFVVGPIDHLLYATVRTSFVMLRMAGLLGKVIVLDEVHATDVHASQFLQEGLRWFGQAGLPVVLLSATLSARQRQALVGAYLAGATGREEYTADHPQPPDGYPSVTAAWNAEDGTGPRTSTRTCGSWRSDLPLTVELLPEPVPAPGASPDEKAQARATADATVADRLGTELTDGGCALVVRNTVERAQSLFTELRRRFGTQVSLLHEQLTIGALSARTADCLHKLAPHPTDEAHDRPVRRIVVATQVAEQAFDIDVDLLITDIAPIDLLLQRIGRLHRSDGPPRPGRLRTPRVMVTGWAADGVFPERQAPAGIRIDPGVPRFLPHSEKIYGRHPLLRAAALVFQAAGRRGAWNLPGDLPGLVAAGYGDDDLVPPAWREETESAGRQHARERRTRAEDATYRLLTRRGDGEGPTLAGLHYVAAPVPGGDAGLTAVVRGKPSGTEAVLLVHNGRTYTTLSGNTLGEDGTVPGDKMLDELLQDVVEIPAAGEAEMDQLGGLPGWEKHPQLGRMRALVLNTNLTCLFSGRRLRYDQDLGLMDSGPFR